MEGTKKTNPEKAMTFVAGKQKLGVPLGVSGGANCWDDERTHVAGRRVSHNSDTFGYNARSEVIGAVIGTNSYGYAHDAIGNRVWSAANTLTNSYTANRLNQYTAVTPPIAVAYDADGNMTRLGDWYHTWDAENRLTSSQPAGFATNGAIRLEYVYNHKNLRVAKIKKQLSGRGADYPFNPLQPGTWDAIETRTFIYDGWNLTAEVVVDAQTGTTNVTRYLWGPDVSGTLQGAGGVGGLLAVIRSDGTFFPCYDANGNITDYVDSNGVVVAHREYDPFGRTIVATGPLVRDLHFWFSTKYLDEEIGLYYYGERFYSPELGRWLNRDPIEEEGGDNLYGFTENDPVNKIDKLGRKTMVGTEGNWTYSAVWGTVPYAKNSGKLEVHVTYTMDAEERKCCDAIHIDRYVRKFLMCGTIGPYVLDHGTEGGYHEASGVAEEDEPDGPSFTFGIYRSAWSWSFKWVATCAQGRHKGIVYSVLKKTYRTSGHFKNQPYSGWFE